MTRIYQNIKSVNEQHVFVMKMFLHPSLLFWPHLKYLTPHLFLKWLVVDKIPFRILTRKRAIVSLGIKVRTASEKFGQIWTKEQMKDEGRWCSGFFLMKKIFSIKKIEKNLCRGFCRKNVWNYWAISSCFMTSSHQVASNT